MVDSQDERASKLFSIIHPLFSIIAFAEFKGLPLAGKIPRLFTQLKALTRYLLAFPISLALLPFSPAASAQPQNPDAYKKFALTHSGDATRGQRLFNDESKLGCTKCHTIDGKGGKAGPDLYAAGDKFGRRDLVDAILTPSATISPGYETVIVETKSGQEYTGTLKQKTDEGLQLMGADGKLISIATADIREKKGSSLSLMPEGLQAALTFQEFTDLIDYVTTLKQPDSVLVTAHGMPHDVPSLQKAVTVRPFFTNHFDMERTPVNTGLTSMRQIPGFTNVFLVLHQKGRIWKMTKHADSEERVLFADMTADIFSDRGPNGLLDVTFHPKFSENHKYYLFYQMFEDGKVTTHIVEKEFDADLKADSGKPGRLIMKFVSVAEDHSGGCLKFGTDGYLYLGMGDTGPHNDPNGHAQNLGMLLGKMMRIDVDHKADGNAYAIPQDNPFVGQAGARPEIWAYGFRNPWRFSFDRLNGELWVADVGQDRVEEVDIVHRGQNYGWNVYEGFEPFSNQYKKEGRTFTMPFWAYRRKYGASVTGGYVYRGDKNSSFYGAYICGDYVSKKMFALTQDKGSLKDARVIGSIPEGLVSFSEDEAGNLYVLGWEGTIYQIDFSGTRFE